MVRGFKSAGESSRLGRVTAVTVTALVLLGGAFAVGRATAPEHTTSNGPGTTTTSQPAGITYTTNGIPTGFPPTRRGAGDAAAWYETLISAAGARPQTDARTLLTNIID